MKFKNLTIMVSKLRLLLDLHSKGITQRKIAKEINLSRTSLSRYLNRLQSCTYTLDELKELSDKELYDLATGEVYKQKPDRRFEILKDKLEYYSKESERKYYTIQLVWEKYQEQYGKDAYSYTTFKDYIRDYQQSKTYTYHKTHYPADVLQVDFAGDKLYLIDPKSGKLIPVVVLCCTLPYSGLCHVIAMYNASSDNLFHGISKCLDYLGGVPQTLLSDNMKQWVIKREKHEPIFSDALIAFSEHYSSNIEATGVRRPKHKASVEGAVHISYQRIYAQIRDEKFFSIDELNNRILDLVNQLNNRPMKSKGSSRMEIFLKEEKALLKPLPKKHFLLKYTRICNVGSNYHVLIDNHYYSLPYKYVNNKVSVVYDVETVEVYNKSYERIAIHKRSMSRYEYTTNKDHMPPSHRAYDDYCKNKDDKYYIEQAKSISEATTCVVEIILANAITKEQGCTSCKALLKLYKYDPVAFKKACEYAKDKLTVINSSILKNIMINKVYNSKVTVDYTEQIIHSNLRGNKELLLN